VKYRIRYSARYYAKQGLLRRNGKKLNLRLSTLARHSFSIYTTDYVFDEVTTLVFRREAFEEAVRFMEGIFR